MRSTCQAGSPSTLRNPPMSREDQSRAASECQTYYQRLHDKCGEVLSESFSTDGDGSISRSHSYIADLEVWIGVLASRPEVHVLAAAAREYQRSLLALLQGQYRYSFSALRLFLELSVTAVRFSAHEIELRLWERGEQDINWRSMMDENGGVLSKSFVRAFCEPLADEVKTYRAIAEKVYRECSEFVHGNAHTHNQVPEALAYDEAIFRGWNARAESMRLTVSFVLAARYLATLGQQDLRHLEQPVLDSLGHLPAIRAFFGAATEPTDE